MNRFADTHLALVCLVSLLGTTLACSILPDKTPTAQPIGDTATAVTSDETAVPATPEPGWKRFEGAGYSLVYPADWHASRGRPEASDGTSTTRYDLIISDASDDETPEYATDAQRVRFSVSYLPRPSEPFEVWVVRQWAWLNADLVRTTIDNKPALSGTPAADAIAGFRQYLWVESDDRVYIVEASGAPDSQQRLGRLRNVIASLKFR